MLLSALAIVIGIVVVGLAVILSQGKAVAGPVVNPGVVTPSGVPAAGRTLGRTTAPVTIDLYGDFRCSACFAFSVTDGTEGRIIATYVATGQAKIVWHDYLVIDKNDGTTESRDAANAAMCAADQGKFWPMHDWLYANQSPSERAGSFTQDRLIAIGKAAGLNMATYQTCVEQGTHLAEIATAQQQIPKAATGTPSVFVNGQLIDPGYIPSYDAVAAAIDAARR